MNPGMHTQLCVATSQLEPIAQAMGQSLAMPALPALVMLPPALVPPELDAPPLLVPAELAPAELEVPAVLLPAALLPALLDVPAAPLLGASELLQPPSNATANPTNPAEPTRTKGERIPSSIGRSPASAQPIPERVAIWFRRQCRSPLSTARQTRLFRNHFRTTAVHEREVGIDAEGGFVGVTLGVEQIQAVNLALFQA